MASIACLHSAAAGAVQLGQDRFFRCFVQHAGHGDTCHGLHGRSRSGSAGIRIPAGGLGPPLVGRTAVSARPCGAPFLDHLRRQRGTLSCSRGPHPKCVQLPFPMLHLISSGLQSLPLNVVQRQAAGSWGCIIRPSCWTIHDLKPVHTKC